METIPLAIISFFIGNISGFFLARLMFKPPFNFGLEQRINWLIFIVSLVWIISIFVELSSTQYQTSPFIHGIMGAIVGFFFWKPKN